MGRALRGWRRIRTLSSEQGRLLVRALFTVALVRLGLWILHPSYLMHHIERSADKSAARPLNRSPKGTASVRDIVWSVKVSSRWIPGASCLTQALSARHILARHGHESKLRVGVARSAEGGIDAHAWVEVNDVPVIGARGSHRFAAFDDLPAALPEAPKVFRGRLPE